MTKIVDFQFKKNLITEKNLINALISFSHDKNHIEFAEDAFRQFFGPDVDDIDFEISEVQEAIFISWYIFDYIACDNKRIIDIYIEKMGETLSDLERNMLNLWNSTYLSVYEVIDVQNDRAVVEDIWTGRRFILDDNRFAKSAKRWELAMARILPVGDSYHFAGASTRFLPIEKSSVKNYGKNKFRTYKKKNPEATWESFMRNESLAFFKYAEKKAKNSKKVGIYSLEGEELVFCKAFFKVNDFKELYMKLKESKFVYPKEVNSLEKIEFLWMDSKKVLGTIELGREKMTLECHNRVLLNQGKEVIANLGGQSVSYQLDIIQDPIQTLKRAKPAKDDLNPAEFEEQIEEYFLDWIDTPVNMFDGKTPKEAVKHKKTREKLIELLKQMEHFGEIAKEQGEHFMDIRKVKAWLNLEY